jgi:chemotaxis signal transduction protein
MTTTPIPTQPNMTHQGTMHPGTTHPNTKRLRTMVCFRSAGVSYCLPVEATRAVRPATGIVALPAPRPDIAGILAGPPPVTVISALGTAGRQILLVEADGTTFGLLVDEVTGLRRVSPDDIRRTPDGQDRALVCGTFDDAGRLVLVVDAATLGGRL